MNEIEKARYLFWRKGFIKNHNPRDMARLLDNVFDYSQVKFGDTKKGEGDIVIINVGTNDHVELEEYLSHFFGVGKIDTNGIYTNVLFSDEFFHDSLKEILNSTVVV